MGKEKPFGYIIPGTGGKYQPFFHKSCSLLLTALSARRKIAVINGNSSTKKERSVDHETHSDHTGRDLAADCGKAGTASASSYDSVAEELSAIGVFRGTAGGFELDRAPTRSEAAIMLVRLYGAEDEAKAAYEAGEISMPFTDVSETAAPSVAWLYSQGITNGTSATTFGASSPCSAKMYCAFLLRALGYEDGVDFLYADTLDFAMLHGLFNLSMLDAAPFLRDDLAAVTYQALGADLKDGSTYLLASLVESGAIDAADARPITEKIEAYRALTAAS